MRTGRRQGAISRGGAAEAAGPPAPPSARTTAPCTSASIRSAVGEGCVPWVCSFRAASCVNRASRLRAFKWRQSPGCKALGSNALALAATGHAGCAFSMAARRIASWHFLGA